jgi:hypothetical protein
MKLIKPRTLKTVSPLLVLLCAVAVSAQSPNPGTSQSKMGQAKPSENYAQQQKGETPQAPIAAVPTTSTEEISPQQNQHYSYCYFQKAGRWIMSIWNVNYTIALATIAYSFVAYFQWRALNKTVAETQSLVVVANRQADAAERQVTNLESTLAATVIAANAAKASADAAVRSDRPVLIVADFVKTEDEGFTLINFKIRNCGKGPALNIQLVGHVKLAASLPYPTDFGECRAIPTRLTVGEAGKPVSAFIPYTIGEVAILLSEAEWIRVENGKTNLFAYGWVTYRDIHRNRYDVRFSAQYLPVRFSGERFYPSPEEYNRHNDYGPD